VALETLAAGLAAVRATNEEVAAMRRHNAAHVTAGESGDAEGLVESDAAFHGTIVAAARSRFASRLYEVLIAELTDFRRKTRALPWAVARSAKGHGAIAESIARHDPKAARAAMAEHLWALDEEILQTAATDGRSQEVAPAPRDALA
jgi:GntR family transcriptional repressor for pyruvate dehydrogenase complex